MGEVGYPQSGPSTTPGLVGEIQRISDRVDALEIASADREEPWYRQAANLLSILAVIVSAGVVLYQMQFEARNRKLEELQQIAVDIVETQKAINEAAGSQANAASVAQIQSFLSTKAVILLSRGVELTREYKGKVPPEIFFILGFEAELNGRYQDAQDFFRKAIYDGISITSQVDARRGLASLYMLPGAGVGSVAEGEKLFGEAMKSVEDGKDPYSVSQRGFLYLSWGQAEFGAGNARAGMEKFSMSEKAYESLPLSNSNRVSGLQDVRQSRALLFQLSEAGHQIALKLSGEWIILIQDHGGDSPGPGTLTVSFDEDAGALSATCSRTPAMASLSNPQIQMSGSIQIQDSRTAVFNWQGTTRSWAPLASPVSGTTTLALNEDGTKLSAVEQRPNLPAVTYNLLRLRPHPPNAAGRQ